MDENEAQMSFITKNDNSFDKNLDSDDDNFVRVLNSSSSIINSKISEIRESYQFNEPASCIKVPTLFTDHYINRKPLDIFLHRC
jgi:hypothetical protein